MFRKWSKLPNCHTNCHLFSELRAESSALQSRIFQSYHCIESGGIALGSLPMPVSLRWSTQHMSSRSWYLRKSLRDLQFRPKDMIGYFRTSPNRQFQRSDMKGWRSRSLQDDRQVLAVLSGQVRAFQVQWPLSIPQKNNRWLAIHDLVCWTARHPCWYVGATSSVHRGNPLEPGFDLNTYARRADNPHIQQPSPSQRLPAQRKRSPKVVSRCILAFSFHPQQPTCSHASATSA